MKKSELSFKKTYRLNEVDQRHLDEIMGEYSMKTENEAVKYCIQSHNRLCKEIKVLAEGNFRLQVEFDEMREAIQNYFETGRLLKQFLTDDPYNDTEEE